MPDNKRVIIVGFDSLDYRNIQRFGLEHVQQEQFGRIDLKGKELKTPIIWSEFVSGTYDNGIDFMQAFDGPTAQQYDRYIDRFLSYFGRKGFHLRRFIHATLFDARDITPDKRFLTTDTLFEKVDDSVAIQVPGYSEYTALKKTRCSMALGANPAYSKHTIERDIDMEYRQRKQELFQALEDDHSLIMAHFHYPDFMGHLYPEASLYDDIRFAEMHKKMDNLAEKVLKRAGEDDLVIFLSDHGMRNGGHTDYAFYSANQDLGFEDTPEIIDFYPRILDYLEEE
jgi:predicted AlkP superfamily pyrophosphatase or phosphodiesterase